MGYACITERNQERKNGKIMNAQTVPAGKPSKKSPVAVKAPKKGSDYVVAAPSHERPGGLDIIMVANHSTLEY